MDNYDKPKIVFKEVKKGNEYNFSKTINELENFENFLKENYLSLGEFEIKKCKELISVINDKDLLIQELIQFSVMDELKTWKTAKILESNIKTLKELIKKELSNMRYKTGIQSGLSMKDLPPLFTKEV